MHHLFFDLDRTLWDFDKNSEIALHKLFHSLGLDQSILDFQVFHTTYKAKNAALWKLYGNGKLSKEELRIQRFEVTLNSFGISDEKIIHQFSEGYIELSPKQTALFPGAIETLKALKAEGFPMHIITNGFKEVQYIKLENCGLAPFFDVVICSEEVGKNKPAPAIFHYALKRAAARNDMSVMIGDDPNIDIFGALGAGMKGVLFDPFKEHEGIDIPHRIEKLEELPSILPWVFRP